MGKASVALLDPGEPVITARDVVKNFRTASGRITPALKGISFDIWQGEFVSVVGRSGSGKSTLVNMITGIDHVSSGLVRVAGAELRTMNEGEMAVWRGKTMGIVFQFFQLLPMLTLIENVMLPMDFCEVYTPAQRETRALELLRRVDLEGFAHKLPGAVSGGQQQSAAVARALATDPPIIMADEPTGNLDSRTAEGVMELFEELRDAGKTILMVTHDPILARRTSRTLVISDGELVNTGVAHAFPEMDHTDMLDATHAGSEQVLTAGEGFVPPPGQVGLVARGTILLNQNGNGDSTELHIGDVIDPQAFRGNGRHFTAGKNGAAVFVLDRKWLNSQGGRPVLVKPAEAVQKPQPRRGLLRGLAGFLGRSK